MHFLVYFLTFPIIWLLSILPFRILYFISDGIYVLIYHVFKYRRKIVFKNIQLAFPQKKTTEIQAIEKKFYHHFIDVFIEMVKSFTISKKELNRRYTYTNPKLFASINNEHKDIMLYISHYANWEWIFGFTPLQSHQKYAVFQELSNRYFNRAIEKSRGRFGVILKNTRQISKEIIHNAAHQIPSVYGILSDQSPLPSRARHWNEFLGVYVPIHVGAEILAKKYEMAAICITTKKIKRGYYESTFHLLSTDVSKEENYSITDKYLELLEKQIRDEPEYYFWTHRRFKHRKKR